MPVSVENMACAFPSSLAQVPIRTAQGTFQVTLPCNELFRIDNIFHRQEYRIPIRYLTAQPITAVDIGANVGLFALYLKSIRPDTTIHCFEPVEHVFELLEKNVAPLPDVFCHPFGLGDKDAVVPVMLHPENTGENSIKYTPLHSSQSVDVNIVAADEAFFRIGLEYIDILKIDTEGCEVEILNSLKSRLAYVGLILIEYHCDGDRRAIDDLLTGFNLFDSAPLTPEIGTLKYINRNLLHS
jgi:FkbM family methyltransferase